MNAQQFWSNMGPPAPNEAELDTAGADWQAYPCREWRRARNRDGYGQVSLDGVFWRTNRLAFVLVNGTIPADKPDVLHRCDNPPCCEPRHLFAGTKLDNARDCRAKGRTAWLGKNLTPDHRVKISAGGLGRRHLVGQRSPEAVANQAASHRARFDAVCRRGHARTEKNTAHRPNGDRECRDCRRARETAGQNG